MRQPREETGPGQTSKGQAPPPHAPTPPKTPPPSQRKPTPDWEGNTSTSQWVIKMLTSWRGRRGENVQPGHRTASKRPGSEPEGKPRYREGQRLPRDTQHLKIPSLTPGCLNGGWQAVAGVGGVDQEVAMDMAACVGPSRVSDTCLYFPDPLSGGVCPSATEHYI